MVSCNSAAHSVSWFMPSSARIVATASGCVMYGSPLLRNWPACHFAATSYARSISLTSALGCVVRTVLIKGSSTGFTPPLDEPKRPSRRLTPAWPGAADPESNPSAADRSRGIDLVAELALSVAAPPEIGRAHV